MHLSPYQALPFLCFCFGTTPHSFGPPSIPFSPVKLFLCHFHNIFVIVFSSHFFSSFLIHSVSPLLFWEAYLSRLLTRREKLFALVAKQGKKSKFAFFANPALRHFLLNDYIKTDFISFK